MFRAPYKKSLIFKDLGRRERWRGLDRHRTARAERRGAGFAAEERSSDDGMDLRVGVAPTQRLDAGDRSAFGGSDIDQEHLVVGGVDSGG